MNLNVRNASYGVPTYNTSFQGEVQSLVLHLGLGMITVEDAINYSRVFLT